MVVQAHNALRLEFALVERGEQKRGQDGDNGDHDQQLN
jgi:hypothetical protein